VTPVGDRNQAVASWRVLKLPVKTVGALRPAPGTAIGGAAVTDDTMLAVRSCPAPAGWYGGE
jgi:hypothetical protein